MNTKTISPSRKGKVSSVDLTEKVCMLQDVLNTKLCVAIWQLDSLRVKSDDERINSAKIIRDLYLALVCQIFENAPAAGLPDLK